MKTFVRKCGNGASVRIPFSVLWAARLNLNDSVEVREVAGRIVIEPTKRKEYDIADLVKGINRKNSHREIDFGARVGNEVW